MRKAYLMLIAPLLLAACAPKPGTTASTTPAPVYPYKIKNPDGWLMDTSHVNTMTALNAIKAFEVNDTIAGKKCFADTLEFNYDGGKFKGTISAFFKMIGAATSTMKNIKIDMKDWEAVVSKNGKEQWVTLWYNEKWADNKGKADSVGLINDIQFKGGKIVKVDEYDMHYAMKK